MNEEARKISAWTVSWEGSIHFNRSHAKRGKKGQKYTCFSPAVVISNIDYELLLKFKELVNCGKVKKDGITSAGKLKWKWRICSLKDVLTFLSEIYDFMPSKKERAENMIKYCRSRLIGKRHRYTKEEMKYIRRVFELNRSRGKDWFGELFEGK